MRHRLTHYVFFLLGIILVMFPMACGEKTATISQTAPNVQWSKTFGGKGDNQGHSVQQTTDNGYIVCGDTVSYGADNTDVRLIKTDADGNKLWDKTFGGGYNDRGNSVQQTADGGYIVGGGTFSYGSGGRDIWLIKTDGEGNRLWDETFGGKGYDDCKAVQQTADGGYVICGSLNLLESAAMWLIKTDANGNKLWDKTFRAEDRFTSGYSVQENAGGGYIVVGETRNDHNHEVILLIRTDADGNKIWSKTFDDGRPTSVQQTSEGGYIICGRAESGKTDRVATWLIKTDADGNKLWDKTFTSSNKEDTSTDAGDSAQQTSDGGYIICGTRFKPTSIFTPSCIFGMSPDTYIWLIKTEADGKQLWDKTFPDKGSAWGNSVQQTKDRGYIVCGSTGSYVIGGGDILLIKIDAEQ